MLATKILAAIAPAVIVYTGTAAAALVCREGARVPRGCDMINKCQHRAYCFSPLVRLRAQRGALVRGALAPVEVIHKYREMQIFMQKQTSMWQ